MTDETTTLAPNEPVQPAIAEEQTTVEPHELPDQPERAEADTSDDDLDLSQLLEDDLEELEWEGKKFKAPKGAKNGLMMQADYTRKTQELADQRRELTTQQESVKQQLAAGEEEMNERVALQGVEAHLEQLSQVNWDELEREDPFGAQKLWRQYQQLQNSQVQLKQSLENRGAQRTQAAQQDLAKRIEETQAYARKEIPGHSEDLDKRLFEFAQNEGLGMDRMRELMSPLLYKLLHRAYLGDQALKKASTAARPAPTPAAPLQTVTPTGTTPTKRPLGDLSMDDYIKARKAGRGG